jgi:hypothetical protein
MQRDVPHSVIIFTYARSLIKLCRVSLLYEFNYISRDELPVLELSPVGMRRGHCCTCSCICSCSCVGLQVDVNFE